MGKFDSIPHITRLQLAELFQIVEVEDCLVREWRDAYFKRAVCVLILKRVVRLPDKSNLSLFRGDYLYDQIVYDEAVDCDESKEKDPRCLQRIVTNGETG